MATEFERIKQAVEKEKTTKMRSEAKVSSLNEEETRILNEASEETGNKIETLSELKKIEEDMQESIKGNIQKMKEVLDEEGVTY